MKHLRIAQIAPLIESVPPKFYGGTERVVSFLTEELVRQGHHITLFASGDSVTASKLIPVCERSLRLDKNCVDQLAFHVLQLQMVQNMKDEFDIIHYHTDYLHYPVSKDKSLPHITTLHGRLDLMELQPLYTVFRDIPVVSISMSQRNPLPQANWVGNVYHGLPEDLFVPNYNGGDYLAFLGRISPEKGLDRAIAIAKHCGIKLKIAAKIDKADSEYFEKHVKQLLNHPLIEYIGEIGENEKNEFLGNAMALLFPIDWEEPFGLVMVEAMACGTPVVAFKRGSVPEIISSGENGVIVGNEIQAADAIRNISSLSRKTCRALFEERFTVSRMADDYVKIYQQQIDNSPTYNTKTSTHEFY